ncbi:MAG: 5-formyltetrahydrofolate cyclo-ligase [Hyphomicrobiaceae bacterium]
MTSSITDQKDDMRETAKAWRAEAAGTDAARDATQGLAATGLLELASAEHDGATISGYFSMPEELDTKPLLGALHAQGFKLALPVIVAKAMPLIFRTWVPGDDMTTAKWGIREPHDSQPEVDPDIVLVPLLAFDKRGFRLGYGGGYYDRTLEKLRNIKPVLAIGLAFDEQEVDAVPHDSYDQRLDMVFTQTRVLRCME